MTTYCPWSQRKPVPRPEGGFAQVTPRWLLSSWWKYRRGEISFLAFRAELACLEIRARRQGRGVQINPDELAELLECSRAGATKALREIHAQAQEIDIPDDDIPCPGRNLPFPRRLLRWGVSQASSSQMAVLLASLIRCVFWKSGLIRGAGRMTSSWIVEHFGIGLRAAKSARQELAQLDILELVPTSQGELNRYGQKIEVNLQWGGVVKSAPPAPEIRLENAPPEKTVKLPTGDKDQQTAPAGELGFKKPLTRKDLQDVPTLLGLMGMFRIPADMLLEVLGLACRARRVGKNPGGLFIRLLSEKKFSFIANVDEAEAMQLLARWRRSQDPPPEKRRKSKPTLTAEQALVRQLLARCRDEREAFLVARMKFGWDRDTWEARKNDALLAHC